MGNKMLKWKYIQKDILRKIKLKSKDEPKSHLKFNAMKYLNVL